MSPDVLLVDGQVFQTSAWVRGMGKYSLALLQAVRAAWPGELHLVLSGDLPHTGDLTAELSRALPGVPVALLGLTPARLGGGRQAEANRAVLDAHLRLLQGSGAQVSFLSLDVLLGETTAVLPSVPGVATSLVVYDLIPLMRHDLYLRRPDAAAVYLSRLGELLRADHLLTISRTVADDLVRELGVDPARVTCIDGGPIDHGAAGAAGDLPPGVREPFVLLPTAADARKNNRRAVMGFARFNAAHGGAYRLAVTSALPPDLRAALQRLSPGVVATGRVSGPELATLYARAAVVLQPSEAEGLGLPLLEAVQRGRRVACSDLPVFREVSQTAFETFDATSVVEIAGALGRAVAQPEVDEAEYARVLSAWSWERTAAAVVDAVTRAPAPTGPRARVLVVGARPDGAGGSGALLQRAHAAQTGDVDYLLSAGDGPAPGLDHLSHHAPTRHLPPSHDVRSTAAPAGGRRADVPGCWGAYDAVVVHLDDDPDCAGALLVALAVAATAEVTVVLHARSLDGTWDAMVEQGLVSGARRALEEPGGLASVLARAARVLTPQAYLEELRSPTRSPRSR